MPRLGEAMPSTQRQKISATTGRRMRGLWACPTPDLLAHQRLMSDRGIEANRQRPYEHYLGTIRNHARGLAISLTYDDILWAVGHEACHYCHATLVWHEYSGKRHRPCTNLDRKDNALGYTRDNIVPCCWRCNRGKGAAFLFEEWYGMTAFLREKA